MLARRSRSSCEYADFVSSQQHTTRPDHQDGGPDPINPDPGRTEHMGEGMSTFTRIAAVVFILGAIAFWAFAFSPQARERFQAPDKIEDPAYAASILARCDVAVAEMDLLPSSISVGTPQERGLIVEQANATLQAMRDDLAALPGGNATDRELIGKWLNDWDFYIADRVAHAEKLASGDTGRFLNTERDGIFIAERMSGFARRNFSRTPDPAGCLPPGDL